MFSKQIGRNVEVYVDDMLAKSKEEFAHLDDIQETFITLKQYQMKLNPSQCAFRVAVREVLRVHSVLERNRSKPREGTNHTRDGVAQDCEKSPKAHKEDSSTQQICLESNEQMLVLF